MYHLPYARLWAETGALAVNPYLRYPLFPYNFELLYAGALLFGNDVVPHLLHALAGWLVAAGIYLAASRFFDRWVGLLAVVFFLSTVSWGFANAYIDLGLTLFVFFSFLSLALWYEKSNHVFLYLAGAFLGLAIGTKYTGLLYVPIFAILVLMRERRPTVLVKLALLFVLSGGYWYLRNYLISGDPVHPLAGKYFGYWLWDSGDMKDQAADIARMSDFIPQVYVPALAAWLLLKSSSTIFRGLIIVAYAAVLTWFATSQYERYLTPAFPFLAILSALVVVRLARLEPVKRAWRWLSAGRTARLLPVLKIALVLIVAQKSVKAAAHYLDDVFASENARNAFLANRFAGYETFRRIENDPTWRVYQFGFEGELYYARFFIVGDVFGPGRYREVYTRAQDAAALAQHFRSLGLNGFLINLERSPFNEIEFDERFGDHFELVIRTERSALYRLRNSTESS
jgi:hypothetical protein